MADYDGFYWGDDVLMLTPDESHVVSVSPPGHELLLLDRQGRRQRQLLSSLEYSRLSRPSISPDSRHMASQCNFDNICAVDLSNGSSQTVPMENPGNSVWADNDTFFVASYGRQQRHDRDPFEAACLNRVQLGPSLGVDQIMCTPARLTFHGLFSDGSSSTAVMLLEPVPQTGDQPELEIMWFRFGDGAILGRCTLPPWSHVLFVVEGPLVVSTHDPNISDGYHPSHNIFTVLDLATGVHVQLTLERLGGVVSGFHRAEHNGAEVILAIRQPVPDKPRFELIRIDLASAMPTASR